jgi:O-methyltransferase
MPKRVFSGLKTLLRMNYNTDGLMTSHICHFMEDPHFRASYALGEGLGSWDCEPIHWRAYVCCWAAAKAALLPGDFVECGVWRGGLARVITNYVGFEKLAKRFYLLDTFEGLDATQTVTAEKDSAAFNATYYSQSVKANGFEAVRSTFSGYSNVHLVKGRIPESLSRVPSDAVAYLSIDMNNAAPEIAAAEFFWPKMVSGGVMVLDDYAYSDQYLNQRVAFDEFSRRVGVPILNMPTGQGLIFKP